MKRFSKIVLGMVIGSIFFIFTSLFIHKLVVRDAWAGTGRNIINNGSIASTIASTENETVTLAVQGQSFQKKADECFTKAIKNNKKIINLYPDADTSKLMLQIALIYDSSLPNYAKALTWYKKYLDKVPQNISNVNQIIWVKKTMEIVRLHIRCQKQIEELLLRLANNQR